MNIDELNLIKQFKIIYNKHWIKSTSQSFGSVGLTFEHELNKKADSLYFPDYYGIEIKCTTRYSRYPWFLFTVSFDGPSFPEINRIVENYGYYDNDFSTKKVLFAELSCTNQTVVNNMYQFKLDIDMLEQKLYLCVFDIEANLIERKSFVYLLSIYNHLMLKLNELALVYASYKKMGNEKYFRYYRIELYRLINFDTFLSLLNSGEIDVSLISRISKSGVDKGRYRNKNLVFKIKKNKIDKLFKLVYEFDGDQKFVNYND